MSVPTPQERMTAYLERRNTAPLLGFYVGGYYPLQRYHGARSLPAGILSPGDLDADAFLPDYERLYRVHAACPGDLRWTAAAFWGIPWLEAALGCQVEADHVTGSCRSRPVDAGVWPVIPQFSPDSPWIARCLAMLQAVAAQAAGRYPLGTTLMRGVSDLMAALLGVERLIYAMLDDPGRVLALAERIAEFWIAFGRAQLDAIPRFAGGYGSFMYNLWAPGTCVWLQEDAAALLSPSLYERFILPFDRQIAAAFDYTFIHLHPARYIPFWPLLDTGLAVVELHIDRGGPAARDLLPVYRAIQERKPLYVWGDIGDEDLQVLLGELDPRGLAIEVVVETPERAHELWARAGRAA